ncbi:protein FAM3C-like isoform X1 [Sinocyclocheilus grahami]|uniref:Protein FAM3C-like n=1 Tax=Sinocyclocheilus grahami TaxID=75366 RepID=A0A672NM93_SINGR|nr:PREDICTED: protein FAM3C-like isoform X1 [Sinocyclocheilus grahami]XP_016135264.1 PREDICTED: protein FAM3C-like isoform X1 [Sinocyclocheilus grahami]XP_016135265.1 PREDICTED: protein FAM3C-like isoform X1 [Sinocyclocheilus grahami]
MIYIRRVGPLVLHKRQRNKKKLRFVFMVAALIISICLVFRLLQTNPELTFSDLVERSVEGAASFQLKTDNHKDDGPKGKCGLPKPCPGNDYTFKIYSGATNIIGPRICFEGKIIIEKDRRGNRCGIHIAVINEKTGEHVNTGSFNMWNGKVEELIEFLKSIEDGSLVLITTFDDPATKLNDEARTLIAELGSSYISQLKFRDNWLFVGGKKTITQVTFEQHIKNDRETNKYESWPEMIEMEGCIPRID